MAQTSHADIESALSSDVMSENPHSIYRKLRETAPVYRSPTVGGWLVTSYDLVEEVLTDPQRFSSAGAETSFINQLDSASDQATRTLRRHFATPQLNTADPPDHTRIRRAFGRTFLKRNVAHYAGAIDRAAREILTSTCPQRDRVEVIAAFAEPLPVRVVAEIVGVPESHRDRIPIVTMDQRHFFGSTRPDAAHATRFDTSLFEWHRLLSKWLDARRSDPRDDVMTHAARVVDSGDLTLDEAAATLLHFIIAGNGTTTALIGNILYALLTHPEQLVEVIANPDLIDNCVEETLRWEAPLPRDRRIALVDTRLGGEQISAGERVYAVLAAANRDPAQFKDPDTFDIGRNFTIEHHASFGRGIHFCLGAPVARLEASIAIRALLDHIPHPKLQQGAKLRWHDISTHRGLVELPIEAAL